MEVLSNNNNKIVKYSKLKIKKYRDEENMFIIEGDHLVDEAINKNLIIDLFTTDEKLLNKYKNIYLVKDITMKKLSSQVSVPNIIGIAKKLDNNKLEYGDKIVILDNINDPGNLGTIIRSASAFNINTLILTNNCVDLYNEKVIRATEGLIFHMNIIIDNDSSTILQSLIDNNYQVYGTDVNNGINISKVNLKNKKTAIIIGNEGNGINNNIKSIIKDNIHIPISKTCESLNASVSASIIMYEMSDLIE